MSLCVCIAVAALRWYVCAVDQEGIDAIFPYMTRQVLRPPFADFLQLLLKGNILLKHVQHRSDAFAAQLKDDAVIRPGCVVLAVEGERMAALTGQTLAMAAWKTKHSLALMIPEHERKSLTGLLTHRQTAQQQQQHNINAGADQISNARDDVKSATQSAAGQTLPDGASTAIDAAADEVSGSVVVAESMVVEPAALTAATGAFATESDRE